MRKLPCWQLASQLLFVCQWATCSVSSGEREFSKISRRSKWRKQEGEERNYHLSTLRQRLAKRCLMIKSMFYRSLWSWFTRDNCGLLSAPCLWAHCWRCWVGWLPWAVWQSMERALVAMAMQRQWPVKRVQLLYFSMFFPSCCVSAYLVAHYYKAKCSKLYLLCALGGQAVLCECSMNIALIVGVACFRHGIISCNSPLHW